MLYVPGDEIVRLCRRSGGRDRCIAGIDKQGIPFDFPGRRVFDKDRSKRSHVGTEVIEALRELRRDVPVGRVDKSQRVLDLGCGTAALAMLIKKTQSGDRSDRHR